MRRRLLRLPSMTAGALGRAAAAPLAGLRSAPSPCARPAPSLSRVWSSRGGFATRAAAPAAPAGPAKGDVVLASRDDAPPLLLLLSRPDGKQKWFGLDSEGCSHSVHPRSFSLSLGRSEEGDWKPLAALRAAAQRQLQSLDPEALQTAWELCDGQPASTAALAELLFADGSHAARLAAVGALEGPEGRLLFKSDAAESWLPRGAEAVRQLRTAAAREAAAAAERRAFADAWAAASAAEAGAKPRPGSWDAPAAPGAGGEEGKRAAAWRRWTRSLESSALERDCDLDELNLSCAGEDAPSAAGGPPATPAEGAAVLAWLNAGGARTSALGAHAALVSAGRWREHENVAALRARIPLRFSSPLLAAAEELARAPPPDADAGARSDLRGMRSFTIDGAETRDIDDALGAEALGGGVTRVWIHIADPTRWLHPPPLGCDAGSALLDAEALRRGTSVYFPTGNVPMFPPRLSEGAFSLLAGGVDSPALSIAADVDEDGSLVAALVTPSTIRVTYRLTYEQADELLWAALDEEPELRLLAAAAAARARARDAAGAASIVMPEPSIMVSGGGACARGAAASAAVSIACEAPRGPGSGARNIVAECMILAGDVVARIAADASLPFPFRTQLPPSNPPSEDELAALPEGPCRAVLLRSRMLPSALSLQAAPHAALGLRQYSQVSSPIRRYTDLLAHHQLKAHLRGSALPYDSAELGRRAEAAGAMGSAASRAQRESERYWTAAYFEKLVAAAATPPVFAATVLRPLREEGLVGALLTELGLEVAVRVSREVRPGDGIAVACTAARPREGVLHFRETQW